MSAAALAHVADTLDAVIQERDAYAKQVAELLERIGRVTGVELSTGPTPEHVAEGLRVLDSLTCPSMQDEGWHWADASTGDGSLGPFASLDEARTNAAEHSDELPNGILVARSRDGMQLAAMYFPPVPKGAN